MKGGMTIPNIRNLDSGTFVGDVFDGSDCIEYTPYPLVVNETLINLSKPYLNPQL